MYYFSGRGFSAV